MKSLRSTASVLHETIGDHKIKEDVIGKAHHKNEWGIDSSRI